MTMEDIIEQLTEFVNQALDMVYDNDYHLISNRAINRVGIDEHHHVGERSIVFRFAHYLQNILMMPAVLQIMIWTVNITVMAQLRRAYPLSLTEHILT